MSQGKQAAVFITKSECQQTLTVLDKFIRTQEVQSGYTAQIIRQAKKEINQYLNQRY